MPEPNDPINPNRKKAPGANPTDTDAERKTNEFVKNDQVNLEGDNNEEDKEKETNPEDFEAFNVEKVEELEEEKNE